MKCILLSLLDLLIILEQQEIIHCDIKPSNILIDTDKNVHLLDFGLAQKIGEPKINFTLYSLGFASPELILNRRMIVDQRSDIYSFGMLIYFLLVGKLPYSDSNPSHFTNLQITYPIPQTKKIDTALMAIIQKCCYKYPFELPPNRYHDIDLDKRLWAGMKGRFQSFKELRKEIEILEEKAFRTKRFRF